MPSKKRMGFLQISCFNTLELATAFICCLLDKVCIRSTFSRNRLCPVLVFFFFSSGLNKNRALVSHCYCNTKKHQEISKDV